MKRLLPFLTLLGILVIPSVAFADPQVVTNPIFYCIGTPSKDCAPVPTLFGANAAAVTVNTPANPNANSNTNTTAQNPVTTCIPRPACLDSKPQCMIAEPVQGWCPVPCTPRPVCNPNPGGPQYCTMALLTPPVGGWCSSTISYTVPNAVTGPSNYNNTSKQSFTFQVEWPIVTTTTPASTNASSATSYTVVLMDKTKGTTLSKTTTFTCNATNNPQCLWSQPYSYFGNANIAKDTYEVQVSANANGNINASSAKTVTVNQGTNPSSTTSYTMPNAVTGPSNYNNTSKQSFTFQVEWPIVTTTTPASTNASSATSYTVVLTDKTSGKQISKTTTFTCNPANNPPCLWSQPYSYFGNANIAKDTYEVQVSANANGNINASSAKTVTVNQGTNSPTGTYTAPANFHQVNNTITNSTWNFTVGWNKVTTITPSSTATPPAPTSYTVELDDSTGKAVQTQTTNALQYPFVVPNVIPSATYSVKVKANANGSISASGYTTMNNITPANGPFVYAKPTISVSKNTVSGSSWTLTFSWTAVSKTTTGLGSPIVPPVTDYTLAVSDSKGQLVQTTTKSLTYSKIFTNFAAGNATITVWANPPSGVPSGTSSEKGSNALTIGGSSSQSWICNIPWVNTLFCTTYTAPTNPHQINNTITNGTWNFTVGWDKVTTTTPSTKTPPSPATYTVELDDSSGKAVKTNPSSACSTTTCTSAFTVSGVLPTATYNIRIKANADTKNNIAASGFTTMNNITPANGPFIYAAPATISVSKNTVTGSSWDLAFSWTAVSKTTTGLGSPIVPPVTDYTLAVSDSKGQLVQTTTKSLTYSKIFTNFAAGNATITVWANPPSGVPSGTSSQKANHSLTITAAKAVGVGTTCTVPNVGKGTCQDKNVTSPGKGAYYPNYCPGPTNVQCLVVIIGTSCTVPTVGTGTCQDKNVTSPGKGAYHPGYCPGPTNIQCLVTTSTVAPPAPVKDVNIGSSCTAPSGSKGTCEDTTNTNLKPGYNGTFYPNLCPGPSTEQCWVSLSPAGVNPTTACKKAGDTCVSSATCKQQGTKCQSLIISNLSCNNTSQVCIK